MGDLGQYLPGESPVHKRDPRVKILTATFFSIIILHADTAGLILFTALVPAVLFLAGIAARTLIKTLRPGWPIFLGLFLIYVFFTPGRPWFDFHIGPVQVSHEGLKMGFIQIWKFLLLLIAASILTMTTAPSEIIMGLERLLRPLRYIGISSHNIAMTVSLALRFLPLLADEMNTIKEAQLARGTNFNPRRGRGIIKALIALANPLTVEIFRRSEELVQAMETRGYQPGPRTYLRELCLSPGDYWAMVFIILFAIAVLVL